MVEHPFADVNDRFGRWTGVDPGGCERAIEPAGELAAAGADPGGPWHRRRARPQELELRSSTGRAG